MVNLYLRLVISLALLSGAFGVAQEFVFVSNRLKAEPEVGPSGQALHQNELFLYRDGSQIRLTFTPEEDEWDPQPSPFGRFLAYVVNDKVTDWAAEDIQLDWNWHLRILDLETLLVLEDWQLPDSTGTSRYAGGFDIAWTEDESTLFVQLPGGQDSGRIGMVEVGNPDVSVIGRGFGVALSRQGGIATTADAFATYIEPVTLQPYPLVAGEGIGWVGTDMVIGGEDRLSLFDPIAATETVLSDFSGYYMYFVSTSDGSRHAWLRYDAGEEGTLITVVDAGFEMVTAWVYPDHVSRIEFMDEDTLLLTAMAGSNFIISAVRISTHLEHQLVSSLGFDNVSALMLP